MLNGILFDGNLIIMINLFNKEVIFLVDVDARVIGAKNVLNFLTILGMVRIKGTVDMAKGKYYFIQENNPY